MIHMEIIQLWEPFLSYINANSQSRLAQPMLFFLSLAQEKFGTNTRGPLCVRDLSPQPEVSSPLHPHISINSFMRQYCSAGRNHVLRPNSDLILLRVLCDAKNRMPFHAIVHPTR